MRHDPARAGEAFDLAPHHGPIRTYVIASTPRSGSTMLARSLEAVGAGIPAEYLNPLTRATFTARWGRLETAQYLERVRSVRTTPNGVFGLKIHFNHMAALLAHTDVISLIGPAVWISLTRLDHIAQAVSLDIARRTGRWWSGERRPRLRPVPYDAGSITRRIDEITEQEVGWERCFSRHRIDPLRLTFERLVDHPAETIGEVLSAIGAEGTPRVVTAPNGGGRPLRWAARYRRDLAAGHPPPLDRRR